MSRREARPHYVRADRPGDDFCRHVGVEVSRDADRHSVVVDRSNCHRRGSNVLDQPPVKLGPAVAEEAEGGAVLLGRREVERRHQHAGFLRAELGEDVAALVADEAVAVEALAALRCRCGWRRPPARRSRPRGRSSPGATAARCRGRGRAARCRSRSGRTGCRRPSASSRARSRDTIGPSTRRRRASTCAARSTP